ncbi:adenylate/guanylate cyclase domain-containing protein [Anaerolineales bacterium HSG25]|nr:adenylate/guanylate cyclase domain-containing protein [Anaerolineales bacterium HSG25]
MDSLTQLQTKWAEFRAAERTYEAQIRQETIASEKLRGQVLIAGFMMTLAIMLTMWLLFPQFIPVQFNAPLLGISFINWFCFYLIFMTIYEIAMRGVVTYLEQHAPQRLTLFQYLNALEEISLPSIFIIMFAQVIEPLYALLMPPTFLYFLLLIMGILRLNFKISIFTGVAGALQYWALAIWYAQPTDIIPVGNILILPTYYMVKVGLLFTAGVMSGVVALEIKRRMLNTYQSIEERNRVTSMFGQHVSPAVVNKLLSQPTEFTSETRSVCIMFLDIRNFTTFSEDKDPTEVVDYLNHLFSPMIKIINQNHGIINKFLGDGFMAVFGAPLSDNNDSRNAVKAAQEIIALVEQLCQTNQLPPTRIGIGLHTGEAVTGHIGSAERKEYTIIGDVVNLAARIEQLNKQFQAQLLVSEAVKIAIASDLDGNSITPLGDVLVKGRIEPVQIYQLA